MQQRPLEDMHDIPSGVMQTTQVMPGSPRAMSTDRASRQSSQLAGELWLSDLRAQLVDAGYDVGRIDDAITSNMARFRSSRLREFVPLLVERSVQRDLRGD